MTRILSLFLLVVAASLASCDSQSSANTSNDASPKTNAILQFQTNSEELFLAQLQVAQNVYSNVTLRLAKDGRWQLSSVGTRRPLTITDSIDAVLNAPGDTVINQNWLPDDATIQIRRLHIDTKVFGNVGLHLTSNKWSWSGVLQELSALTLADFQANLTLAATESHHTVLHSAPENGPQRYPMQLKAKIYKFCMDKQDDGADKISLLDASGQPVLSLKAGDACVSVKLAQGTYTMQHEYGGTGTRRTLFVHPATKANTATAQAAAQPVRSLKTLNSTAATDYPEYAAIFVRAAIPQPQYGPTDGFLSFNGLVISGVDDGGNPATSINGECDGVIDAAAQRYPWSRQYGVSTNHNLFESKNFFRIVRDSNGVTSALGLPLTCAATVSSGYSTLSYGDMFLSGNFDPHNLSISPKLIVTNPTEIPIKTLSGDLFQIHIPTSWSWPVFLQPLGFLGGLVSPEYSYQLGFNSPSSGLNFLRSGQESFAQSFRIAFRYFPNGLPPSLQKGNGDWVLTQGQVALFAGSDCTGPAMISENWGLLAPQPVSDIGGFSGSLQLGLDTVVTVTPPQGTTSQPIILNELGCIKTPNFGSTTGAVPALDISTNSAVIVISTNQCTHCNLAGVDLSNKDLSNNGHGVELMYSDLSGADLSNSNLSNADMSYATLQGARLNYTNLESAVLSQASLNAYGSSAAASLTGAHLKNAKLDSANLDGANFSYASFYGASASASNSTMNNTRFNNAYLAGLDLSSATGNGASFSGAILIGASFKNGNFNHSAGTGAATDFSNAFLQGADFTNAQLGSAIYASAYIETDSSNDCMQINLDNGFTLFPGFTVPTPPATTPASCVAGHQTQAACVQVTYTRARQAPVTDSTNTCPDGSPGPCSDSTWASPKTTLANSSPKNSTCKAQVPLCGDAFTGPGPNVCW